MQQRTLRIVTAIALGLLLALFAYWAFTSAATGLGLLFAALSCGLYGAILVRFLSVLARTLTENEGPGPDALLGARALHPRRRHPWVRIVLWTLASRLLLYAVAYLLYTRINGYAGGMWDTLRLLWLRTDSPSYLGIAQNGYVTVGDARFHIVFFPLYPACIRAMWYLVRDYFVSALLVSNLFAAASAVACYELSALALPREDALRAVRYMLLLPAAFFLGAPMSESLFLFLSLMGLYFARKRKFLWACLFAALSGLARLPGVLLGVPIAIEMAAFLAEKRRAGDEHFKGTLLRTLACLLVVPLGLACYLYINYRVTGAPLTFLTYQREHWSQCLGFFFATSSYQSELAFAAEPRALWGLFLPNLIACFGALYLVWRAAGEMRAAYSGYFLAYYAVTAGATWLLSAPRYLTVAYPLLLACALRGKEPARDILLCALCVVLLLGYMTLYVLGYPVY